MRMRVIVKTSILVIFAILIIVFFNFSISNYIDINQGINVKKYKLYGIELFFNHEKNLSLYNILEKNDILKSEENLIFIHGVKFFINGKEFIDNLPFKIDYNMHEYPQQQKKLILLLQAHRYADYFDELENLSKKSSK